MPAGAAGAAVPWCFLARGCAHKLGPWGPSHRALVSGVTQTRVELVSLPSAASWGLADGVDGRPGVSHQSACGGAGAAPQGLHREPAGPSFAGSILLLPHFPNYRCSLLIFAGPGADLQTGVNPSLGPFSCSEGTGPRSASAVYVCVCLAGGEAELSCQLLQASFWLSQSLGLPDLPKKIQDARGNLNFR